MKDKVIFIDLDHTMLDTDLFFHIKLRNLAIKELGINSNIWQEAYKNVFPSGYSMKKHFEEMHRLSGSGEVSLSKASQLVKKNFSDLEPFIFTDVIPFVKKMRNENIDLYILSFGSEEWQKYKITASGLDKYFDGIILSSQEGKKAEPIKDIAMQYKKVIVIDNSPQELDAIKTDLPDIITFQINRAPEPDLEKEDLENGFRWLEARKYPSYSAKCSHLNCKTLSEIQSKIIKHSN